VPKSHHNQYLLQAIIYACGNHSIFKGFQNNHPLSKSAILTAGQEKDFTGNHTQPPLIFSEQIASKVP